MARTQSQTSAALSDRKTNRQNTSQSATSHSFILSQCCICTRNNDGENNKMSYMKDKTRHSKVCNTRCCSCTQQTAVVPSMRCQKLVTATIYTFSDPYRHAHTISTTHIMITTITDTLVTLLPFSTAFNTVRAYDRNR